MSWEEVKFGDIIEFNPGIKLEKGELYDFIPMEDIQIGQKYVSDTSLKLYTGGGAKFKNGDILFARITPSLEHGKRAKVKELETGKGFGSTEFFVFRAIDGISDPDYIYYLASNDVIRQPAIKSMVGASGRQRADKGVVENIQISLPPLPTQRKIAGILAAYDDLIENNLKRIKLLEEAAQNIYKEWFVNFRFPGHENTKFITREDGTKLPEGWEKKEIKDIGTVVTGKTPSTTNASNYGLDVPFIKTPDMHKNIYMEEVEQYLSREGADSQSNKYLPENTVVTACIGARAGVVAITSKLSQTNQQINAIVTKKDFYRFWLYFLCKNLKTTIHAIGSSGATMTNVSKGKFESINIIFPKEQVIKDYDTYTKKSFEQILLLQKQNQILKAARDILLPRLMNRTIAV